MPNPRSNRLYGQADMASCVQTDGQTLRRLVILIKNIWASDPDQEYILASDPDQEFDSTINPDQEYIYFMGSETLPFAGYILFESSIPFYSTRRI